MRGIEVSAISFFFLLQSYKRILGSGGRGLADERIHLIVHRMAVLLGGGHVAGVMLEICFLPRTLNALNRRTSQGEKGGVWWKLPRQ
jgi:hypothetical protein